MLRFRGAGADVVIVAPKANHLYSSKLGLPVYSDAAASDIDPADIDALVIPGGFAPEAMRKSTDVIDLVRKVHGGNGIVAAICHAGWVLASAGIAKGRRLTCVPVIRDDVLAAGADYVDQPVVRHGNLITSRLPNDLPVSLRAPPSSRQSPSSTAIGEAEVLGRPPGKRASAAYDVAARIIQAPAGRATANYTTTSALAQSRQSRPSGVAGRRRRAAPVSRQPGQRRGPRPPAAGRDDRVPAPPRGRAPPRRGGASERLRCEPAGRARGARQPAHPGSHLVVFGQRHLVESNVSACPSCTGASRQSS